MWNKVAEGVGGWCVNKRMNNIMKVKSDYYVPCVHEFSVDENPYGSISVDITQRCNIKCNVCHNPVHSNKFDFTLEYWEEVCKRLPNKVRFKLLGGEPTVHPQFFELLDIAHKHGHGIYVGTNGLRFLDDDFMERYSKIPYSVTTSITFDGGLANEEAYEAINGRPMLQDKLAILERMKQYKIKRIGLSAIIIRGLNEEVLGDMIKISEENKNVRYIIFRNLGEGGSWIKTEPFYTKEFVDMLGAHYSEEQLKTHCHFGEMCLPPDTRTCCKPFMPNKRLQIVIQESLEPREITCPYKGRLLDENFIIQSCQESYIATSNKMSSQYGEIPIKQYKEHK